MSLNTTITLSKDTAEIVKKLAGAKGVSQGIYLKNLLLFCDENKIDYTIGVGDNKSSIPYLLKRFEYLITVTRGVEKARLIPMQTTIEQIKSALVNGLADMEEKEQKVVEVVKTVPVVSQWHSETLQTLIDKAQKATFGRGAGYDIKLTQAEYDTIKNVLAQ